MRAGLQRTPQTQGYLELGASVTRLRGPEGWAEAGYRLLPTVGVFARGYVDTQDRGVMGGVRFDF